MRETHKDVAYTDRSAITITIKQNAKVFFFKPDRLGTIVAKAGFVASDTFYE